jgi:hypothetical protein
MEENRVMAKARKTRRAKQRRAAAMRRERAIETPRESTVTARRTSPTSFAEEYQYVIADLKRIFMLAGVMLAALVVLALVLR